MREKEFLPLVAERLKIGELNPMQKKMLAAASDKNDIILLSPTGSGKTLAFLLPLMKMLKAPSGQIQAVIIAPSRELVIQIAGIVREIAHGYKVTALYGGHKVEDEQNSLLIAPDIIVATPGRLLDHIKRRNLDARWARILVLDEFDKSLELGFEDDMKKILSNLKNVSRTILTSATDMADLPEFIKLNNAVRYNFLDGNKNLKSRMRVYSVESDSRDKLDGLLALLRSLAGEKGADSRSIVFVNHRESAERVAEYLKKKGVGCVLYHGQLDQRDREKAVAMFNNGSCPVLVATDLAARGLDIEGVKSIVHYHQPFTEEAYTHRNGRTARVQEEGDVYVMLGPDEEIKPFVVIDRQYYPDAGKGCDVKGQWTTLYIGEGKKEKLSRGDVLGFLSKECGLAADEVGKISVYDHYILVAVAADKAKQTIDKAANAKIKGHKVKIGFV